MKWLRYLRVISLKIQVGNTNQRNKWANTDPRIYQRWDHVPRRSKHLRLIDHTRREPIPWSCMRRYPLSKSVYQVLSNYWYEKCQTTYGSMKVFSYKLDHCNGHRTCENADFKQDCRDPCNINLLSVVYFDSKNDHM
jgi:hypothetical protein